MNPKTITYAARSGRVKTTVWFDRELLNQIKNEADKRRVSQQSIIENSLKDRYSEARQLDRDAAIAERLNKLERHLRRIEEKSEISAEAQALFVRMWLASTPEVPTEEREKAVQSAQDRYARYLQQLVTRIGSESRDKFNLFKEIELKLDDF